MNEPPQPSSAKTGALLRLDGIAKRFGAVTVLSDIALNVGHGEIHALVGENGAGKSTLMHILAGVLRPDAGRIDFNGVANQQIASPRHAQELGIATVFQERSLFPHLSVAENIFAGRQPVTPWRRIDRRQLQEDTRRLLEAVGLGVEPEMRVEQLAPDQQQMVEIAKALSLEARLIIFDEPSAALTETETRALFRVIAQLRGRGVGLIYISHRLEEIFGLADRVTVLRDGRKQATRRMAETTPDELVRLMVGRSVSRLRGGGLAVARTGPPALEVRQLCDPPSRQRERSWLHGVSFAVWAGEVVALAGLAGAGRTEAALSIMGARRRGGGEVLIDGRAARIDSPAGAIAAGVCYLPEDRKTAGIFSALGVRENVVAAGLRRFGTWWLDRAAQEASAAQQRDQLKISCRTLSQSIRDLSGGNQQKCLLARWLILQPKVLIADEPTRGVDVGAKAEVHALLRELSRRGTAVVVISSDLPEVLAVADRILVMRQGRISGELDGATATEEAVMTLASLEAVSAS